jgi:hypothetical protein
MSASSNRRTLVNLSVAASSAAIFAAGWVGVVGADEERAALLAAESQSASDLAVVASAAVAPSTVSPAVTVPAPSAAAVAATTAPAAAAVQATPAPVRRVVVVRPSRAS